MNTTLTVTTFNRILEALTRIDSPEIDLTTDLITLAQSIRENEPDSEGYWLYLGEGEEFTCSDLIVGAYWALAEWHGGQNDPTYAALCELGRIFSPVMTDGPEPDSSEECAYQAVSDWYQQSLT
jgi:hypothetical protein